MNFIVEGKPIGKARPRVTTRGGFARAYTPKPTTEYETQIKTAFLLSDKKGLDFNKPIKIAVVAAYEIPKSFSRKEREQALQRQIKPCVKPDIDNVIKTVLDALNDLAYADDKQVTMVKATKLYGERAYICVEIENDSNKYV